MHNTKSNFDKVFHTIKSLNLTGFNEDTNIYKPGNSPLCTDIEAINLALVAEFHELCTRHYFDDPIIMLRGMIGTKAICIQYCCAMQMNGQGKRSSHVQNAKKASIYGCLTMWAHQGSNLGPPDYELF